MIEPQEESVTVRVKCFVEHYHVKCFTTVFASELAKLCKLEQRLKNMHKEFNKVFEQMGYDAVDSVEEFLDWLEAVANEHVGM